MPSHASLESLLEDGLQPASSGKFNGASHNERSLTHLVNASFASIRSPVFACQTVSVLQLLTNHVDGAKKRDLLRDLHRDLPRDLHRGLGLGPPRMIRKGFSSPPQSQMIREGVG